jgi:hypothetical protein
MRAQLFIMGAEGKGKRAGFIGMKLRRRPFPTGPNLGYNCAIVYYILTAVRRRRSIFRLPTNASYSPNYH